MIFCTRNMYIHAAPQTKPAREKEVQLIIVLTQQMSCARRRENSCLERRSTTQAKVSMYSGSKVWSVKIDMRTCMCDDLYQSFSCKGGLVCVYVCSVQILDRRVKQRWRGTRFNQHLMGVTFQQLSPRLSLSQTYSWLVTVNIESWEPELVIGGGGCYCYKHFFIIQSRNGSLALPARPILRCVSWLCIFH